MEFDLILNFIVLIILLVSSGIFSGSETAFFSLNHLEKERLKQKAKGKIHAFILIILDSPQQILITILTGNMVVNLFFASMLDQVMELYIHQKAWYYSVIAGTILVLIFGEMYPKNLAIKHSLPFMNFISPLLNLVFILLTPFRIILRFIEKGIIQFASRNIRKSTSDNREIVSSTLRLGLKKGIIQHSEISVMETFFDFREKTVEDVMTPRTEIEGISEDMRFSELVESDILKKYMKDKRYLIPVYKTDIDHITGYLNIQDCLVFYTNAKRRIKTIIRKALPVPESKNLLELLRELIEQQVDMALIIDEYGGTAGIISFQEMLEDFLRFFYPETDILYNKLAENNYRLPANFSVKKLSGLLDLEIKTEKRTLGGLLTEELGEIPLPGTSVKIKEYEFIIRKVSKNKILEVEVIK